MEVVVTTGLLELQIMQSSSQIIITNKPTPSFFYRPDALPVAQPTVSKHWRENYHIPWTCLPQAHLGVFQLCLWPLIAPGYLGGGLPCLTISPVMPVPLTITNLHENSQVSCWNTSDQNCHFGSAQRFSLDAFGGPSVTGSNLRKNMLVKRNRKSLSETYIKTLRCHLSTASTTDHVILLWEY